VTEAELQQLVLRGEDSRHQFKQDVTNADSLAAELAAFANSGGGRLVLGVADTGTIAGLDARAVQRINQLLGNASSQHVRPPVHPTTENVATSTGVVIVVTVPDGLDKPYMDNVGRIWVKLGADTRHVTARDELQRMFQRAALIYADLIAVAGSSSADLDVKAFGDYLQRRYGQPSDATGQSLDQVLQSIGLGDGRELNLAGLMLFAQRPQRFRPAFVIKAVAFPGTVLHDTRYLDSEDIDGVLPEQFVRAVAFLRRNLHHVQGEQGSDTLGQLEIPEPVLEELLVNALIHRDYVTSASIRLMVFADRVEIISPGHLPDSLSTDAIRRGATNRRNPTLTDHAAQLLPDRGLGSGIPRALDVWPAIELIDEPVANQFRVVVQRPAVGTTGQVTPPVTVLLRLLGEAGELGNAEIRERLGLKDRAHLRERYMTPAMNGGWIEMTLPDKPSSRLQRYRLTAKGAAALSALGPQDAQP